MIGLRKGSGNFEVEEWDYGLIMKEKGSRIKIITVYNNKKVTKLRESLDTIMEKNLNEEGSLIIIGDWNARIGEENARIEIKKEENWKRKSEDKTLNNEGKKMLDFCKEYGITIMNGRMRGDEEGKYTHLGENGASVIGYIMIKEDQEELPINKMEVGLREESDHLPIKMEIKREEEREKSEETNEKEELGWKWREEKKEEYQRIIMEKWKDRRRKEIGNIEGRLENFMKMIRGS